MSEKLDHDGLARWSKEQFEKAQVTRGAPIERLADPDLISGDLFFALTDKINELIERINLMSEVK